MRVFDSLPHFLLFILFRIARLILKQRHSYSNQSLLLALGLGLVFFLSSIAVFVVAIIVDLVVVSVGLLGKS